MVRVGVPFEDGRTAMLAAAKLRVVELHDAAYVARITDQPFCPHTIPIDAAYHGFSVVLASDCAEGSGLCLVGESDMEHDDVDRAKEAVGAFAREVTVCCNRAEALLTLEDIGPADLELVAAEVGAVMPAGARQSLRALVNKHMPPLKPGAVRRCACGAACCHEDMCATCLYRHGRMADREIPE